MTSLREAFEAEKLIALRRRSSLSQKQLGLRVGVSTDTISDWESSASIPLLSNIIVLASAIGAPVSALLRDPV